MAPASTLAAVAWTVLAAARTASATSFDTNDLYELDASPMMEAVSNEHGIYGWSIAATDTLAVVGAPEHPNGDGWNLHDDGWKAGAAYIHKLDSTTGTWQLLQELAPAPTTNHANAGHAVAIANGFSGAGAVVAVGVPMSGNVENPGLSSFYVDNGNVAIYTESASGDFSLAQTLQGTGVDSGCVDSKSCDAFGAALAMDDSILVVGAPNDKEKGLGAGAIYVFEGSASGSEWSLAAKLTASDAEAYDNFGISVAVHDGVIVAGAWQFSSLARPTRVSYSRGSVAERHPA